MELVKNGYMYGCSKHTVGEIADSSVSEAQWDAFHGEDGNVYVNLTGIVTFDQSWDDANRQIQKRVVTVMFQFEVKDDDFELYAITINGRPPDSKTSELLFKKICP
jgi:hypothetical protein